MNEARRNKGPEHIRDIIKEAKDEWLRIYKRNLMNTDDYLNLLQNTPSHIQLSFIYIEGDPQYLRTIYLN